MWNTVTEWASGAANAVGDFFTGGGGQTAANAGEAMAQAQLGNTGGGAVGFAGDMFSSAAGFAGDAFGWIEQNPNTANLLGGVAMGVGQAYSAQQDREAQRELQRERLEAQQILPTTVRNYGGYQDNITGGLISNGMIASETEQEAR